MKWIEGQRAQTHADVDAWATFRKALFTRNINRAKRLRKARIDAGLTQVEVALAIGIAGPSYWAWESGHRNLDDAVINEALKAMTKLLRKAA